MAVDIRQQSLPIVAAPDQPLGFNPKTITWERLEARRLQRLGISNRYSRHFDLFRVQVGPGNCSKSADYSRDKAFDLSGSSNGVSLAVRAGRRPPQKGQSAVVQSPMKSNSIAPFATDGKPTCGVFFSDRTDNRKRDFGIPPSDLVKWRNTSAAH